MAMHLDQVAEYYRVKGFEDIAKKAKTLAQEAREQGMPDRFSTASSKRPKGPATPELARELNIAMGSNISDEAQLRELEWIGMVGAEEPDNPYTEWSRVLKGLNSTQRATIRNALHYLKFRPNYNTVGAIRQATVEQLANLRRFEDAGDRLGRKRAEFLKIVFGEKTE